MVVAWLILTFGGFVLRLLTFIRTAFADVLLVFFILVVGILMIEIICHVQDLQQIADLAAKLFLVIRQRFHAL